MSVVILCLVIYVASWVGGSLPAQWRWNHTWLQLVLSFVGGFMLGVGMLHLLPHGLAISGSMETVMPAALVGLLTMFFLIRIFHVHIHAPEEVSTACQHGVPHAHGANYFSVESAAGEPSVGKMPIAARAAYEELGLPMTESGCGALRENKTVHRAKFGWIGLAMGLSLHMALDGVVLSASVAAAAEHAGQAIVWGPFLAILLHEPLDIMSITTVMRSAGWSPRATLWWNALFAAMCPLGVALCHLGLSWFLQSHATTLGVLLGFSAGMFLCISLADLLPELQFHSHDRWPLSLALLAGVGVAFGLTWLEPHQLHQWPSSSPSHVHSADPFPLDSSDVDSSDGTVRSIRSR